jgi:hypothetical protein
MTSSDNPPTADCKESGIGRFAMNCSDNPPTVRLKAGMYVFADQLGHNSMRESQIIEEITPSGITLQCGFFNMRLAQIKFDKKEAWYDLSAFEYDVGVADGEVSHRKTHLYMTEYM